jgi:hypothetical protein
MPRRFLLAILRARGLPVPWEAPKAALIDALVEALAEPAAVQLLLTGLSPSEQKVLQDLLLADGPLPRRHLTRQYGTLPPYRPWRSEAPARPWEAPVSPLERLWYLGLIFLDPASDALVIPAEIRSLLPPPTLPPPPQPGWPGDPTPVDAVCHDLASLLGLLQRNEMTPLHHRWLPPRLLARWGQACVVPPVSPQAGSELQTGRRRFLHYLAENAGWLVGGAMSRGAEEQRGRGEMSRGAEGPGRKEIVSSTPPLSLSISISPAPHAGGLVVAQQPAGGAAASALAQLDHPSSGAVARVSFAGL